MRPLLGRRIIHEHPCEAKSPGGEIAGKAPRCSERRSSGDLCGHHPLDFDTLRYSIGAGLTAERAYRNQRMALAAAPLTFPTVSLAAEERPAGRRSGRHPAGIQARPRGMLWKPPHVDPRTAPVGERMCNER